VTLFVRREPRSAVEDPQGDLAGVLIVVEAERDWSTGAADARRGHGQIAGRLLDVRRIAADRRQVRIAITDEGDVGGAASHDAGGGVGTR
jgi:hypothetical protein